MKLYSLYAQLHLIQGYPKLHRYWARAKEEPVNARVIAEQIAAVPPVPVGAAA